MRRRQFISAAISAALGVSALDLMQRSFWVSRVPDILTYLDRQITPAAAAQAAAAKNQESTVSGGNGKLGQGDIFWSVMWPYMYTVGKAEGTVENSQGIDPYKVIYTYDSFESFDDHPRRSHPILDRYGRPTGKSSDASGWPQFLSTTWDGIVKENPVWYDGPAFQPANQDLGFLYLHRDTGGHAALMKGVSVDPQTQRLTVSYKAFMKAIAADSQQWASLPGADIGAETGQHTRPNWWLWTQFQWALWKQMGYRRRIIHPIGADKVLTSPIGYQAWRGRTHWGQDFGCATGTPILAPEDGVVTLTGYEPGGGNYIGFRPNVQPELELVFRHCQTKSPVKLNTLVKAGEEIGRTGNTGSSTTAPHAHIEVTVDGQHINPHYYLGMATWF